VRGAGARPILRPRPRETPPCSCSRKSSKCRPRPRRCPAERPRSRPRGSTSSCTGRSRGPIPRASKKRCSAWAASGAPSASFGNWARAFTSPPSAMPPAIRPTRPTRRFARAVPATTRWCWWSTTRRRFPMSGCSKRSGRTTTRPRACARATTRARSIAQASTRSRPSSVAPRRRRRRCTRRSSKRGASMRSPPRSPMRRHSILPRTTTSNIWRRTRWAIAASAAPA